MKKYVTNILISQERKYQQNSDGRNILTGFLVKILICQWHKC